MSKGGFFSGMIHNMVDSHRILSGVPCIVRSRGETLHVTDVMAWLLKLDT
jgi:hypothetical protein